MFEGKTTLKDFYEIIEQDDTDVNCLNEPGVGNISWILLEIYAFKKKMIG